MTFPEGSRLKFRLGSALVVFTLALAGCSTSTAPSAPPKPTDSAKAAPAPPEAAKPQSVKPDAAKPAAPATTAAAPGGVDLAGKTVRLIVGYTAGGGFDTNARLLVPYLQEVLPGHPTIVVENMPGADSLVAAKSVLSGPGRSDEVNVVIYISTLITKSILSGGLDGFAIEKESAYLGKPDGAPSPLGLCAKKNLVGNLDEFLARSSPLKVGGLTGSSNYDVMLRWTQEVGYPIQPIFGYPAGAQMVLAFNQGEVDAVPACRDFDLVQNPDWLEKDLITPLFYWAVPAETLKKAQAEGKYPWYKHVLEVKPVTADQKAVLDNWNDTNVGSNVYAMHKQTPAPLLAIMRDGFRTAASNPAYKADIERRQLPAGFEGPETIEKTAADVEKMTPSARELLKRIIGS